VRKRDWRLLALIVVIQIVSVWIDWPFNRGLHLDFGPIHIHRDIELRQGLDLRGGLQVLLAAGVPESERVERDSMEAAKVIVENRVNALGVTEPLVQLQGERFIVLELPGIEDPDQAIAALKGTGLLEFVDAGTTVLPRGALVRTSFREGGEIDATAGDEGAQATPEGTVTASAGSSQPETPVTSGDDVESDVESDEETAASEGEEYFMPDKVFETVFTGKDLANSFVSRDDRGAYQVNLEFREEAARRFAEYTGANIGKILAIVLDGRVLTSPRIETRIPDGKARITGDFTLAEARSLSIQLKYGALPVPLRVEETRSIGPTLGQDSVQKSIRAGVIGLSVVLLFMAVYYRIPGLLADLALITYALINMALYKTIPVTITLPGVTGFLLSTGMAVDANILIFERMKEELRWGRSLRGAIDAGFNRAWTSIRDSNLSALITCVVLFWFGSNFGATQVKGFAITLFLGVLISMFTAITVTRTLVRLAVHLFGDWLQARTTALGV